MNRNMPAPHYKIRRGLYEKVARGWYHSFYVSTSSQLGYRSSEDTTLLCRFWRLLEEEFNTRLSYKNKYEMLEMIDKFFGYKI